MKKKTKKPKFEELGTIAGYDKKSKSFDTATMVMIKEYQMIHEKRLRDFINSLCDHCHKNYCGLISFQHSSFRPYSRIKQGLKEIKQGKTHPWSKVKKKLSKHTST